MSDLSDTEVWKSRRGSEMCRRKFIVHDPYRSVLEEALTVFFFLLVLGKYSFGGARKQGSAGQ